MKKVSLLFFLILGITNALVAGEDAAFDFTNDALDHLDDTTQVRRTDDGGLLRDFPLDDRLRDQFFTTSPTTKPGVVALHPIVHTNNVSQNKYVIFDPQSFEQDISPRDRAALDALNDDHAFFRDLDDEDKKVTPVQLYRIQLNDCRELIGKSADGVRKADPVLYELMQPKFALAQKEVKNLMGHVDALQEHEIVVLETMVQELKTSLVEKIVGRLFRVLIFDALELAGRKLSHIRTTLVNMQLKQKRKKAHSAKKGSNGQIEEAPYADY